MKLQSLVDTVAVMAFGNEVADVVQANVDLALAALQLLRPRLWRCPIPCPTCTDTYTSSPGRPHPGALSRITVQFGIIHQVLLHGT